MNKTIKWVLMVVGALAALGVVTFSFLLWGLSEHRDAIEPEARELARRVLNDLSELSEEQFNAYWGPEPPSSPEQRKFLIEWAGQLGRLEKINTVELQTYGSTSTLRTGKRHSWVYRIDATYTNGEAAVVIPIVYADNMLTPVNLIFFSEVLGNMADLEALED